MQVEQLGDAVLVEELRALVGERNRVEAELLVRMAEVDRRRLYLDEATDSMFRYCVERLGLSEGAAAKRIQVARLSRRFPEVVTFLREGRVHLTGLGLLAPHMTDENHVELLESASGKSKREIEQWLVGRAPKAAVATSVSVVNPTSGTPRKALAIPAPVTYTAGKPARSISRAVRGSLAPGVITTSRARSRARNRDPADVSTVTISSSSHWLSSGIACLPRMSSSAAPPVDQH